MAQSTRVCPQDAMESSKSSLPTTPSAIKPSHPRTPAALKPWNQATACPPWQWQVLCRHSLRRSPLLSHEMFQGRSLSTSTSSITTARST